MTVNGSATFPARFRDNAERTPDRPAVVVQWPDGIETTVYADLDRKAAAFAARLAAVGIGADDRCALLGPNGVDWIAAYLGIMRLGAVVVPLDPSYAPHQITSLLADSGAAVVLAANALSEAAQTAAEGCPGCVALSLEAEAPIAAGCSPEPAPPPPVTVGPQDAALILYTSGTTAEPKGVVLTHECLSAAIDGLLAALPLDERDCSLGMLPLFHILGQVAAVLMPLAIGCHVVLLAEVTPAEIMRALAERRITILCSVPQFFYLLQDRFEGRVAAAPPAKRAVARGLLALNGQLRRLGLNLGPVLFREAHRLLGSVRLWVSAGAAFDPAAAMTLRRFGFDVLQAYGLTETTGAATFTRPERFRVGSVGEPIAGVRIDIVDDNGGSAPPGVEGEIAISGPTVMREYYGQPAATEASLPDGRLRTGDIGVIAADGQLEIRGRAKEVLVRASGRNVYPEEVEQVIDKCDLVKESCVILRDAPNATRGDALHALIVPDAEAMRAQGVANMTERLRNEIETLMAGLPAHKRVQGVEVLREPLPRTTTRKIKRHVVLKQWQESQTEAPREMAKARSFDPEWVNRPGMATTLAMAPTRPAALDPDDNLELDLGYDSLRRVELIAAIEAEIGRRLPDVAMTAYTARELAEIVASAEAQTPAVDPVTPGWTHLLESQEPLPLKPAGVVLDAVRYVFLKGVFGAGRMLLKIEVMGIDRLPRSPPFILCCNHQSYLDGFLILSALPYALARQTVMLGKTRHFSGRFTGWFARRFNILTVDADANLMSGLSGSAEALRSGRPLFLFPEGERSIDGEVKPLRRGAGILACHLGLPVVPAAIDGTFAVWPRGKPVQGPAPVKLGFGAPIHPMETPPDTPDAAESATADLTRRLQDAMRALLDDLRQTSRR